MMPFIPKVSKDILHKESNLRPPQDKIKFEGNFVTMGVLKLSTATCACIIFGGKPFLWQSHFDAHFGLPSICDGVPPKMVVTLLIMAVNLDD